MKETVYIGVSGADLEYGVTSESIRAIRTRTGDGTPVFERTTKGYVSRQRHINNFIDNTRHDYILMLDGDMAFYEDTLDRLRSHQLPYVSGLYMRREVNPMAPVWFRPFRGRWPMEPWVGQVERGKLHEIGASGWGCILMHRDVVVRTREILRGEWEVIEDDMDIEPYDLGKIVRAMRGLRALVDERPASSTLYPALDHHLSTLEREIVPLRCDKSGIIGSDIRFPYFAKRAGFTLYGDPEVRAMHMLQYPLSADDYDRMPQDALEKARIAEHAYILDERRKLAKIIEETTG